LAGLAAAQLEDQVQDGFKVGVRMEAVNVTQNHHGVLVMYSHIFHA
jgi:hypothetical protein